MNKKLILELTSWAKNFYPDDFIIEEASVDASFRSYYRIKSDSDSKIIMNAPPSKEPLNDFIAITNKLGTAGINVPKIYEIDSKKGYILMSDFGNNKYLDALNKDTVYCLYTDAIDVIYAMQTNTDITDLMIFNQAEQLKEIELFNDWFIHKHLNKKNNAEEEEFFNECIIDLCSSISKIPCKFMHRDFHSRNLMVLEEVNPGVLDYQDALIGPITYDLVSLLKDCYIKWDDETIYKMTKSFYQKIKSSVAFTYDEFEYWFDITGVQRHLKAIGIFSRLNYRDGKSAYMKDIPRTYSYIQDVLIKYKSMNNLRIFLDRKNIQENM